MNAECERQITYAVEAVRRLVDTLLKNERIHGDHILFALAFSTEELKNQIIANEMKTGRSEQEAETLVLQTVESAAQTAINSRDT